MREEEEAREYCLHRPLSRPRINFIVLLCIVAVSEWCIRIFAAWLYMKWASSSCLLISYHLCYGISSLLFFAIFGRWIAIGCILLYQRYAPESVRRKCCCKPTCSEYAILAFRKYGLFIGGYKTYIRLFHTCRSGRYVIDYP